VYAMGLSMGGTLVTRLAEEKGHGLTGLILVNPSYATQRFDARFARYIAWAVPSRPGIASDIKKPGSVEYGYERTPVRAFASLQQLWAVVRADFARVTAPTLLFRSRTDHVVEPLSAQLLHAGATSTTVREVVLEDSYHVATLDNDAPAIFAGSVEFIHSLTAAPERSDPAAPQP
jgi:carboxylesterase